MKRLVCFALAIITIMLAIVPALAAYDCPYCSGGALRGKVYKNIRDTGEKSYTEDGKPGMNGKTKCGHAYIVVIPSTEMYISDVIKTKNILYSHILNDTSKGNCRDSIDSLTNNKTTYLFPGGFSRPFSLSFRIQISGIFLPNHPVNHTPILVRPKYFLRHDICFIHQSYFFSRYRIKI